MSNYIAYIANILHRSIGLSDFCTLALLVNPAAAHTPCDLYQAQIGSDALESRHQRTQD